MPTIKIDDVEYDLDTLSKESKQVLDELRVIDLELERLRISQAVAIIARNAKAEELKKLI